jgi:hypothetical protein
VQRQAGWPAPAAGAAARPTPRRCLLVRRYDDSGVAVGGADDSGDEEQPAFDAADMQGNAGRLALMAAHPMQVSCAGCGRVGPLGSLGLGCSLAGGRWRRRGAGGWQVAQAPAGLLPVALVQRARPWAPDRGNLAPAGARRMLEGAGRVIWTLPRYWARCPPGVGQLLHASAVAGGPVSRERWPAAALEPQPQGTARGELPMAAHGPIGRPADCSATHTPHTPHRRPSSPRRTA